MDGIEENKSDDLFRREVALAQCALFTHIFILLRGDEDAAWEVLQETNLWLLRHASTWHRGECSLLTFAKSIAVQQLRKFRLQNTRRAARMFFDEEMAEKALQESAILLGIGRDGNCTDRLSALRLCIKKLPRRDRSLLSCHYADKRKLREIAKLAGESEDATKQRLCRIRRALRSCILDAECRLSSGELELPEDSADALSAGQIAMHALLLFEAYDSQKQKALSRGRRILSLCKASVPLTVAAGIAALATFAAIGYSAAKASHRTALEKNAKRVSTLNGDENMNITNLLAATALAASTAGAGNDVFADAAFWLKFDRNDAQNKNVQKSDFVDVLTRQQAAVSAFYGPEGGGPVWTNMSVRLPARGLVREEPAMYLPVYTNESKQMWSTTVELGSRRYSDKMTVIARVCPKHQNAIVTDTVQWYVYNHSLDWGGYRGAMFGFQNVSEGKTFRPSFFWGQYDVGGNMNSLTCKEDEWYDIAWIMDTDEDKATFTIVVADAANDIRTQSVTVANTFNADGQGTRWRSASGTSGTCWIGAQGRLTNYFYSRGNWQCKAFHGAISQLAVWYRAMSVEEAIEAIGYPRNLFAVGVKNGSGAEFAGSSGEYTDGDHWEDFASTVEPGQSTTIRFTPPAGQNDLGYCLHVASANVGGAEETTTLRATINGKDFGAHAFRGNAEQWWFIPSNTLSSAENQLVLQNTGAYGLTFDKVSMEGSWRVRSRTGNTLPSENACSYRDFYVGDQLYTNLWRAVVANKPSQTIRFYMPEELARKYRFQLGLDWRINATPANNAGAQILLNNEVVWECLPGTEQINGAVFQYPQIVLEAGKVQGGWNELKHVRRTDIENSGWHEINGYTLNMLDNPKGTVVLLLGE